MKARVAASVVLAVGVAIGTAGCGFLTPQETTQITKPTEFGVQGNLGDIHIRNAYIVADGGQSTLVATFVNAGTSDRTVAIEPNASSGNAVIVKVGKGAPTVVGPTQHVQWDNLKAKPGSLLPLFFTYGGTSAVTLKVPVLTSDFAINSTLTPTPAATGTATPGATSTATPGATSTATPGATATSTPTPTPAG